MIAMATKYPNVYIDTSAYKVKRYPPQLRDYLRGHGRKKVLFGSNFPMITPSASLADLDDLELDDEARRLFLGDNAARVFALDPLNRLTPRALSGPAPPRRSRAGWVPTPRSGATGTVLQADEAHDSAQFCWSGASVRGLRLPLGVMLRRIILSLSLLLVLPLGACTVGPGDGNSSGSHADASVAADGGLAPFMSSCTTNDDCESGLCYSFNQGGPLCDHSCTVDADCEAPSIGCNKMGVCKRPGGDNDHSDGGVGDGGVGPADAGL